MDKISVEWSQLKGDMSDFQAECSKMTSQLQALKELTGRVEKEKIEQAIEIDKLKKELFEKDSEK